MTTDTYPGAAYAALPEPIAYQIAVLQPCEHGDALVGWRVEPSRQSFDASMRPKRKLYTEGDMHDFADRTHALRASHGQAPAGATSEQELEDALRERDDADDFIDALLDEVLGTERAEWSSAYGRADALEEVRERVTALHKPAVDRAWTRFEAATEQQAPAQPAPQHQARPVTPYTCPKCSALWLHWPAEQSGFGRDTLNCRSTTHCDYCEKGGVEQLQRLERVPAVLAAPQQEASPTTGMNIAQRILHVGGRNNAAGYVEFGSIQAVEALVRQVLRDLPSDHQPSPAAQGDALDAARYHYLRDVPMERWPAELLTAIRLQQNAKWDAAIDAARAAQEGK